MSQSHNVIKQEVLAAMVAAIANDDWPASCDALHRARSVVDPEVRADILNNLLLMPGHKLHQEVSREIQSLRAPSSVPYIRRVLAGGFDMFEYTCSEPGVIAKWFSHALANIGTPEAIAVIEEFAGSKDREVADEMAYRLRRLMGRIDV